MELSVRAFKPRKVTDLVVEIVKLLVRTRRHFTANGLIPRSGFPIRNHSCKRSQ